MRGNIKSVEEDENLRAAVIKVSATRVFRQKYTLFTGNSRLSSRGEIRTLLQCGVKPGPGSFLFTGRVHFGEAWLGCAPRYKDFQRAYTIAKAAQQIPCELPVDWDKNSARLLRKIGSCAERQAKLSPVPRSGRSRDGRLSARVVFPKAWGVKWTFQTPFQCNTRSLVAKSPVVFVTLRGDTAETKLKQWCHKDGQSKMM